MPFGSPAAPGKSSPGLIPLVEYLDAGARWKSRVSVLLGLNLFFVKWT